MASEKLLTWGVSLSLTLGRSSTHISIPAFSTVLLLPVLNVQPCPVEMMETEKETTSAVQMPTTQWVKDYFQCVVAQTRRSYMRMPWKPVCPLDLREGLMGCSFKINLYREKKTKPSPKLLKSSEVKEHFSSCVFTWCCEWAHTMLATRSRPYTHQKLSFAPNYFRTICYSGTSSRGWRKFDIFLHCNFFDRQKYSIQWFSSVI